MNEVMELDAEQIERIVREVMGRLGSHHTGGHPSNSASSGTSAFTASTPLPEPTTEVSTENSCAAPTLILTDRLVTMACVSGRLEGIQCVQVDKRAIVTPLVVDQLREQGIRLARHANSAQSDRTFRSQVPLSLSADENQTRRVAPLLDEIAPGWNSLAYGEPMFAEIVRCTKNRHLLVCTERWASFVCRINRHQQLRASVANSVSMVEQACQQADINVLVIDSAGLADLQLHNLIRQYVHHVQRRVAAA